MQKKLSNVPSNWAHTKNQSKQIDRPAKGLVFFALLALLVFYPLLTAIYLYTQTPTQVAGAATNSTINFQARLLSNTGALVVDGDYHVEFKLYNSLAGGLSNQGVCAGGGTDDCEWVETRTTGNLVTVKNGYLTASLGEVSAFPANMDWSQQLYLSMRIGGTGAADWTELEMSPRMKVTSVPFAQTAGNVKSADTDGANSGNVSITTGDAATSGNSGNVTVDVGTAAGATGTVSLGAANASSLLLGNASSALTVTGNSGSTFVLNGITVDATEFNRLNGKDANLLDVNDAVATAITGTGALTVGVWQATAIAGAYGGTGQTTTTAGDLLVGAASNTWSKLAAVANGSCLISNGVGVAPSWGACGGGGSGVTTVGALNGGTNSANGAFISGTTIYMQTADATNPGLVSTGTQTFAGAKTFNGGIYSGTIRSIGDGGSSDLQITNNDGTKLGLNFDFTQSYPQVGVNTNNPNATLAVFGNNSTYPVIRAVTGSSQSANAFEIGTSTTLKTYFDRNGQLYLGNDIAAPQRGTLVLSDNTGSNGFAATVQTAASLTDNRAITLPDASGTVLLSTTGFLQGGNTFGATATLGTNDNFDLNIETNNLTRLTVEADGDVGIGTTTPGAGRLVVNNEATTNDILILQDGGTDVLTVADGGAVTLQNQTDSTTALQVLNETANGGITVFNIDTVNQQLQVRNKTDNATIGADIFGADNNTGSGTNWSDTGVNTWTHTTGSTADLTITSPAITAGTTYEIDYTTAGTTSGESFTLAIGGVTGGKIYGNVTTNTQVITTTGTGSLTITPTSDQSGSITINSVSVVTNSTSALAVLDDAGATALEVRAEGTNLAIGLNSLQSNTTGYQNTATGHQSLYSNTAGRWNTAIGFQALYSNTTGDDNTAIGVQSLYSNTTGFGNIATGYASLYYNTTGNDNNAYGRWSLWANATGSNNVGVGTSTLTYNKTGSNNVVLGYNAGHGVSNNSDVSNNVVIGYQAGYVLQTGADNNIALGYQAGDNITTGSNNIIIGYDLDADSATADSQLNLGGVLQGSTSTLAAQFNGTLEVTTLGATDNASFVCRNTANILAGCNFTPLSSSLVDNVADALDIQEGTNNYINVDTTDGAENISFGNATTNPSYDFLGTGTFTVGVASTYFSIDPSGVNLQTSTNKTFSLYSNGVTGTVNIGNNTSNSGTKTINIGSVNGYGNSVVNIASHNTPNQTVTIGGTGGASSLTLQAGTGGITLNGDATFSNDVAVTGTADFTGSIATKRGADYSTTGTSNNVDFGDVSLVRLTGASAQTITGIAGGRDGEILAIVNAGSNAATISDSSGTSLAANRITTGLSADISLSAGSSISLIYDAGASLWRVNGDVAGGSGSGVTTVGAVNATATANAASITGTTINLHVADATNPGIISTGAQTIAGSKTFNAATSFGSSISVATLGTADSSTILCRNSSNQLATCNSLSDAQISNTLTSSIFIGSGSTTNAIDLATAEVAGTLAAAKGGTGVSSYTTGDILFASGAIALSKLAAVASGSCLVSNGIGVAPSWGNCDAGGSGITTVGALNGGTNNANGAFISGTTIYMQTADAANPGLVSTGAQTLAGAKTFTGVTTITDDSTTALRVRNAAASQTMLTVDTTNNRVIVGDGDSTSSANTTAFVLDSSTTANAPTGLAGAMYYDTSTNKFRCYQAGAWTDCIGSGGGGGGTTTANLTPEFSGVVLNADGSNNSGTLSSGWANGLSSAEGEMHNYYSWTTSQSTAQDYDIVVRYQLPNDYSAIGAAGTFKFWHEDPDGATTNSNTTWTIYDEVDETQCFSTTFEGTTAGVWEEEAATTLGSCSWSAGDYVTMVFKVKTTSGAGELRLGEVEFQYDL